jgi:hypothetical protein
MKSLLVKIGLSILIYLLDNEVVHNAIMNAAKKTSNNIDDVAAESVVKFLKDLSKVLSAK